MKISELIVWLEQFRIRHGDLDVETYDHWCGRVPIKPPSLEYKKILNKRERRNDFWCEFYSKEKDQKGEPVCKL